LQAVKDAESALWASAERFKKDCDEPSLDDELKKMGFK